MLLLAAYVSLWDLINREVIGWLTSLGKIRTPRPPPPAP